MIKRTQLINRLICSDNNNIIATAKQFLNKDENHTLKLSKSTKNDENCRKKNCSQSSTHLKNQNQARYIGIDEPVVNLTRDQNLNRSQNPGCVRVYLFVCI